MCSSSIPAVRSDNMKYEYNTTDLEANIRRHYKGIQQDDGDMSQQDVSTKNYEIPKNIHINIASSHLNTALSRTWNNNVWADRIVIILPLQRIDSSASIMGTFVATKLTSVSTFHFIAMVLIIFIVRTN